MKIIFVASLNLYYGLGLVASMDGGEGGLFLINIKEGMTMIATITTFKMMKN